MLAFVNLDLVSNSNSHRAILRSLIRLNDHSGRPVPEMEIANTTPYEHPVNGQLTRSPIVPNADGTAPGWFVGMLDELSEDGLVKLHDDSAREWLPTTAARERLAAFDGNNQHG